MNMMRQSRGFGFLLVMLAIVSMSGELSAQNESESPRKETENSAGTRRPVLVKLTTDQEQSALRFARKHHPELAQLLEQLQKKSATGFSRGIREVHLSAQRLERFREKQPARFELELQSWKLSSEIRLLTAKWVMSQDPALEKQIQELLRERQQTQLERLRSDRERLLKRLQELDREIRNGTEEFDAQLAAEWDRLQKQAGAVARTQRRTSEKDVQKSRRKASAKNENLQKTKD